MQDVPTPATSTVACVHVRTLHDRLRHLHHAVHIHSYCSMLWRDDVRLSQAYRYIAWANSWLQKVASAQQIAESLDDVFSLSSFKNAQSLPGINGCLWRCKSNQCCVAFWHVVVLWDFIRAKSNLSVAFAEKHLSTRSEQQALASLWCTCNPVASSPK